MYMHGYVCVLSSSFLFAILGVLSCMSQVNPHGFATAFHYKSWLLETAREELDASDLNDLQFARYVAALMEEESAMA